MKKEATRLGKEGNSPLFIGRGGLTRPPPQRKKRILWNLAKSQKRLKESIGKPFEGLAHGLFMPAIKAWRSPAAKYVSLLGMRLINGRAFFDYGRRNQTFLFHKRRLFRIRERFFSDEKQRRREKQAMLFSSQASPVKEEDKAIQTIDCESHSPEAFFALGKPKKSIGISSRPLLFFQQAFRQIFLFLTKRLEGKNAPSRDFL